MKLFTAIKSVQENQDIIPKRLKKGINRKYKILREIITADAPV